MLRIYKVYMADTDRETGEDHAFIVTVPAEDEDKARDYCAGNGEIIAVRDVTEKYQIDASLFIDSVVDALKVAGFGRTECDIVGCALSQILQNVC